MSRLIYILSVDHITGKLAEKKVVTTVNKVSRITELDIDGELIQCTETHPFQAKGKGFCSICVEKSTIV